MKMHYILQGPLVVGRGNKVNTTVGVKCLLIAVRERVSSPIHGDPQGSVINISAPSPQIEGIRVPYTLR